MAAQHGLPPGLSEQETLEVFAELGVEVPETAPADYAWDGVEY